MPASHPETGSRRAGRSAELIRRMNERAGSCFRWSPWRHRRGGGRRGVAVPGLPARRDTVPTTRATKGPLKLTRPCHRRFARGPRPSRSSPRRLAACCALSRSCRPERRSSPATSVVEFDPADQQYALEQAKSELDEAEQEIVKIEADAAVQAAQDEVRC